MFFCVPFRKGFEAASKDFEPQDLDVSVVGRSFMITGANSGIGRETAMAIAKKGKWQRGVLSVAHLVLIERKDSCVCFQVGRSTWCAGTKIKHRRPGRISSMSLGIR